MAAAERYTSLICPDAEGEYCAYSHVRDRIDKTCDLFRSHSTLLQLFPNVVFRKIRNRNIQLIAHISPEKPATPPRKTVFSSPIFHILQRHLEPLQGHLVCLSVPNQNRILHILQVLFQEVVPSRTSSQNQQQRNKIPQTAEEYIADPPQSGVVDPNKADVAIENFEVLFIDPADDAAHPTDLYPSNRGRTSTLNTAVDNVTYFAAEGSK